MPNFRYEVRKGPGDLAKGVLEAESQRAAVAQLRDLGYFPIRVEEHQESIARGEWKAPSYNELFGRITLNDRNVFFRQLANLTDSGMVLSRALRTLVDQTENPKMRAVIEKLRDDVTQGHPLADAMENNERIFPSLYCSLVRAGEAGGMLEEVLWRIVSFGEQEDELRGKATNALIYPAFLTIMGSGAVFILVSFVFPKFVAIFEQFNTDLPWPTQVVMTFCNFMGTWWWAVLIGIGFGIAGIVSYLKTESGRHAFDQFVLSVPVLKVLVQKYEMAKFARTLGTLLDNGVPVLTALRITAETLSNRLIRDEVSAVHAGVTEGESLSGSLKECRHFAPLVVSMFAVGEESGRIGAVAKRVADAYDVEVDRAVKAVTALFEPILIVVMGVVIGFLVIAMLLPIMNLSSTIG